MAGIVTAQDLVAALASHHTRVSKEPVQEALSVEKIKQEFERMRETSSCCNYHKKRPPDHRSRQLCAVAKTALLIDAICTLCYSCNLANFRAVYTQHPELHTVDVVHLGNSSTDPGADEREDDSTGHNAGEACSKSSCNGYRLCYEVVKKENDPFSRHGEKVKVSLAEVMSRLLTEKPGLRENYV
ncbi:hypothetical protein COOONC_07909 [Cooperia oncophora]